MNTETKSPDLGVRTKDFALRVIRLCETVSNGLTGQVIAKQLIRCGTSVGAQYREARRARSKAEFAAKVDGALQELEESGYWMELLVEGGLVEAGRLKPLMAELEEIKAMLVASSRTVKRQPRKDS